MKNCSLGICFRICFACYQKQKTFESKDRDTDLLNWYLNMIFYTYWEMAYAGIYWKMPPFLQGVQCQQIYFFPAWNSLQDLNLCFSLRVFRNYLIVQCYPPRVGAFKFYMNLFVWEEVGKIAAVGYCFLTCWWL